MQPEITKKNMNNHRKISPPRMKLCKVAEGHLEISSVFMWIKTETFCLFLFRTYFRFVECNSAFVGQLLSTILICCIKLSSFHKGQKTRN